MAAGDIKWFAQGLLDLGLGNHNLATDVFKLGIINNTVAPAIGTPAPHWGGTGTTNFASTQVSTGGTSYTGPITLASQSWTLVANVPTFRGADITLAQDAAGFTNGRYAIVYNNTDANKRAIGFIDFGSDRSIAAGSLVLNFQGAGTDIFTITQP